MDLFSRQVAAAALVDGQHFTLPGFGTLEGSYVSARIDHASRKVDPPNLAVHWHVVVDEEAQTFAELLARTGATSFEAEATELAWTAALTAGESIEVGDLGTLRLDPLTKHTDFLPNRQALAQAYWGGGAVAVEPLPRGGASAKTVQSSTVAPPASPVAEATPTGRRRSLAPYLFGFLALLAVGAGVWYLGGASGGTQEPVVVQQVGDVDRDRLNRSPLDPEPAAAEVAAPAPVDDLEFAIADPSPDPGPDALPAAFDPAAFDPAALAGEDDFSVEPYAPQDFNAVIIVGSFTSSRYTERLHEQILAAGLVPYVDHPGSLDRVGIAFAASSQEEVLAMLERMRRDFGKDAWILD